MHLGGFTFCFCFRINRKYVSDSSDEEVVETLHDSPIPPRNAAGLLNFTSDAGHTMVMQTPELRRPRATQRPSNRERTQSPLQERPTAVSPLQERPPAVSHLVRQGLNKSSFDGKFLSIFSLICWIEEAGFYEEIKELLTSNKLAKEQNSKWRIKMY